MEKESEKLKTMILFLLMFAGINYSLFTFLIQSKMQALDQAQASYERGGESQSIYDALVIDKERLDDEILELSIYEDRFDAMVQSDFDTLQVTYDFYAYAQGQAISGVSATYDLASILAYAEILDSVEEVAEEPVSDEEEDPYEVRDISEETADLYLEVVSDLNLMMKVGQLESVLTTLPYISDYQLYPYEVRLTAQNMSSEEVDTDSDLSLDITEGDTLVGSEEPQVEIALFISYKTYLPTEDLVSEDLKAYDFYQADQGHEDLMTLFAPNKETDESADIVDGVEEITTDNNITSTNP